MQAGFGLQEMADRHGSLYDRITARRRARKQLRETGEQIATIAGKAAEAGRAQRPRISVSFRPILGKTDEEAWERAHSILDTINGEVGARFKQKVNRLHPQGPDNNWTPENAGSRRLQASSIPRALVAQVRPRS